MPILEISVVLDPDERLPNRTAGRIADAAGEVFHSPAGETWVQLRTLERDQYAESGSGPPEGVRPVFIRVLLANPGDEDDRQSWATGLAAAIGPLLHRPIANTHVIFEPAGSGRVAFGGWLTKS